MIEVLTMLHIESYTSYTSIYTYHTLSAPALKYLVTTSNADHSLPLLSVYSLIPPPTVRGTNTYMLT